MPAADFSIRADGLRAVEARLGGLAARLGDLTPLMDWIGERLEMSTRLRFETSTAPDGETWKPSERNRHEAVPRGDDDRMGPLATKTLVRDGHLRDSIEHLATPTSVEVGSNLIYARIHQLGGTIRPVNAPALSFRLPDGELIHVQQVIIPARPYLGISASDVVAVEAQVERYAEGAA